MSNGGEVVRYEKSGKWFLEDPRAPCKRLPIDLTEAVRVARLPMSTQIIGVPGGRMFDARLLALALDDDDAGVRS